MESCRVTCWTKLWPLRGGVDTCESVDCMWLLGSVVHEVENYLVVLLDELGVEGRRNKNAEGYFVVAL